MRTLEKKATVVLKNRFQLCRIEDVGVIRPLRHAVLRTGLGFETTKIAGDDELSTLHFAVIDTMVRPGRLIVCCGSYMLREYQDAPAWQLRLMATHPDYQSDPGGGRKGFGLGKMLFRGVEDELRQINRGLAVPVKQIFWKARREAVGFYLAMGGRIDSDEFLELIGHPDRLHPHRYMSKRLLSLSCANVA